MTARPADLATRPRAHDMGIYKRCLDLIAAGTKTTEIRVDDSSRARLTVGSLIRFRCRDEEVLTRVTRLNRYPDFDTMFDHESPTSVNPTATREEQLANIRQIYPPEREALGVVAIGIELLARPTRGPASEPRTRGLSMIRPGRRQRPWACPSNAFGHTPCLPGWRMPLGSSASLIVSWNRRRAWSLKSNTEAATSMFWMLVR